MESQPPIKDPLATYRPELPLESEMLGWRTIVGIVMAAVILLGTKMYLNRNEQAIYRAASHQGIALDEARVEERVMDPSYVRCVCSSEKPGNHPVAVLRAFGKFYTSEFPIPFAACENKDGSLRIVTHDWKHDPFCSR
jgi:hypothetical protein